MSERFLKFIPSDEALWLLYNRGHAFRLLAIIAESARRYDGGPDGLKIGECFIGGHENYDMTERNYRTAKEVLVTRRHVQIVETCRTRKKSTTGTTTVGTKIKLLSTSVWDINLESTDDRSDDRPTTDRRPTDDKQEREESKEREENKNIAQPAKKRLRSKDSLSFNFEEWKFTGITESDMVDWGKIYPSLDLAVEILKAGHWLKDNPSKSNKTLWRRYLTGWLRRANEWAENKKAYQSAKGNPQDTDRRTKDAQGEPVENQYSGRF